MISNDWWWPPVHSQSSCVCWWWPDYWGCCRHKIGENIEIWIFENIIITIMFNIGETENHTSRAPLWYTPINLYQFVSYDVLLCLNPNQPSKPANKQTKQAVQLRISIFGESIPCAPPLIQGGCGKTHFCLMLGETCLRRLLGEALGICLSKTNWGVLKHTEILSSYLCNHVIPEICFWKVISDGVEYFVWFLVSNFDKFGGFMRGQTMGSSSSVPEGAYLICFAPSSYQDFFHPQ